jgi:hypothetical protein
MIKPKTIFAAAALAGLVVSAVGLIAEPFSGSAARAAANYADMATPAARIDMAFASLNPVAADPALRKAAARVAKGDLFAAPGCAGQTWPDVTADCLTGSDGSHVSKVRTVTVGYQTGDSTTVLLRHPTAEASAR